MKRGAAWAFGIAAFVAAQAVHADGRRPYDAPDLAESRLRVPPTPLEYLPEDGGWIQFSYHPHARERVRALAARANAVRAELVAELGRDVLTTVDVRVAADRSEMASLSPAELPEYATAAAFSRVHLVVMSLGLPLSLDPPDLEAWFRHELAHVALDEALAGHEVPRWFHEGFAVGVSGEAAAERAQTLSIAALRGRLLPMRDIENALPDDAPLNTIAHAQAADLARFLRSGSNRPRFHALVERVRAGEPFESALVAAYGSSLGGIEAAWRRDMARRYGFLPVLFGALALWLLVLAGVLVRRLRRRAATPAVARPARPRPAEATARSSSRPEAAVASRVANLPPETEVPKVEHDGHWYTLH